jgi:hypothetical protein
MKGVCGCEYQTKCKQPLSEAQSRMFENQGTHFIIHYSFFIFFMDYENRDSLGNLLLKIFSVMRLIIVLSGFVLYFIASRFFRRKKENRQRKRCRALG